MTDETLDKLCEAYRWGCSDREACLHAEIAPSTLYEYQKENPEFPEHKRLLQSRPTMLARATVVEALTYDPQLALKYLERRLPEEFNPKRDQQPDVDQIGKIATITDLVRRLGSNPPPVPPEVPRAGLTVADIRQLQAGASGASGGS